MSPLAVMVPVANGTWKSGGQNGGQIGGQNGGRNGCTNFTIKLHRGGCDTV